MTHKNGSKTQNNNKGGEMSRLYNKIIERGQRKGSGGRGGGKEETLKQ